MSVIKKVNYSHVCGDYTLYNTSDKKVVTFFPSRPDKMSSDKIKQLSSCLVLKGCNLISLSDVHIYKEGTSGEHIPHPDFPDRHYSDVGLFVCNVIKKTIRNYNMYLKNGNSILPLRRENELPQE